MSKTDISYRLALGPVPGVDESDRGGCLVSSWTDLSHDDFSSAMHSVNSIFARHDLAAYSLQIPVGNLLNPMVPMVTLFEASGGWVGPAAPNVHPARALSIQDIWNMVGPSKVDRQKKFQQGFLLVLGKRRNVADKRAARHESFEDLRMKASSWMEAGGLGTPPWS